VAIHRLWDGLVIERDDFQEEYGPLGEQITAVEAAIADAEIRGEHLDIDTGWGYLEHILYNSISSGFSPMQKKRGASHI
jgi:hypothetical protein